MVSLHKSVFEYLKPTEKQMAAMDRLRTATAMYASLIENTVPPGADKTYLLRKLREVSMWCNVAITRHADGSPRRDDDDQHELDWRKRAGGEGEI